MGQGTDSWELSVGPVSQSRILVHGIFFSAVGRAGLDHPPDLTGFLLLGRVFHAVKKFSGEEFP